MSAQPPSFDANFRSDHHFCALQVDFERHTLSGTAAWDVDVEEGCQEIVLDSKGLSISGAWVDGVSAQWTLTDEHEVYGEALRVSLLDGGGRSLRLTLRYSTSPQASALQWLAPPLTAGGVHPYLFTQCEPIHARTLLPCPDSPAAKFTYEARVRTPPWATALMSALRRFWHCQLALAVALRRLRNGLLRQLTKEKDRSWGRRRLCRSCWHGSRVPRF